MTALARFDLRSRFDPRHAAADSWLTQGGDDRILVDAATGANKYGCAPYPDDTLLAFGSSTASTVSGMAFAAAGRLRARLTAGGVTLEAAYRRELERLRGEFRQLCGLDDLPGLELVFAASGTDLHLIAALLTAGDAAAPLAVMVEANETGSGVPAALAGRHFSVCSALRLAVARGGALAGKSIDTASIATRLSDGAARPLAEIDAEAGQLVAQAAASGRKVLLTLVDISKTGLLAPSPACALRLQRAFPGQVRVMVDACQFRIAPATLRAYLEQGLMVAVTGSKFLTGPTFSGLLLIPGAAAAQLRAASLSPALAEYCSRAEWPAGWPGAMALPDQANMALLMRWQAAMAELRAFLAVPPDKTANVLTAFAASIQTRLELDPALEALPGRAPDRSVLGIAPQWDAIPTIFPFLLRRGGGRGAFLTPAECRRVYIALLAQGIQIGQPVACGARDGQEVVALRLCASARLAVEAAHGQAAAIGVIRRALAALDRAVELAADVKN